MIRVATILLAVLSTAGTTQLLAQQPILAPVTERNAPQASSPGTPLPGPRLAPELRSYEPNFGNSRATVRPLLATTEGSNHTFVFSTLALVLIGVIVVLLVI